MPFHVEIFGTRLATGSVPAELQADGTVRVRDLPIFSEVRASDPGAVAGERQIRDKAWLQSALVKHQQRLALGKRPIMTLRHGFDKPERVGTYELTRVDEAEVNPNEPPRATLFGDKIYEDMKAFEKARLYDFRSPEISPDKPDELAALALLRDKEPYASYPNLVEKLEPALAQAFSVEAFRARIGVAPQTWANRREEFASLTSQTPSAVAQSMLSSGQITKAQHAQVLAAFESQPTKEGAMPDATPEKKAPSLEERMEAMAAKCFEGIAAKFESMFKGAVDKGTGTKSESNEGSAEKDTKAAGGTEKPASTGPDNGDPSRAKKDEAAEARTGGVNDLLPPAVSQLRPGEVFSAKGSNMPAPSLPLPAGTPEAFSTRVAVLEQANLGLRASVEKMERREAAGAIVADAKKQLLDSGAAAVSEAFEAAAFSAAVEGGKAAVDRLVRDVKIGMGVQNRQGGPEIFQNWPGSPVGSSGQPEDLKKAIETFGNQPESKRKVEALYGAWMAAGEHQRRAMGNDFFGVCQGRQDINEGWRTGEVKRG